MASPKMYEMEFALNATMNGSFSGTFSKAQQEFTKLGKEIQGLHKVQGDISSYQKQQQAVDNTRAKLESLQKQHDLLQKEIGETSGSTTSLERENVKLVQRIKDTETALERQNQKLKTTGERLESAGVDAENLSGESARLSSQLDELRQRQQNVADTALRMGQAHEEAAGSAATFGEQSAQAIGAVQEALAAAGIAAALKEIAVTYMECVGVAADFQEGMSGVQAISGATSAELELLSAKAKEMGANSKFTALEASSAMAYMGMAGWKAGEMISGIEGIMNLAAASGEDLASTSDIVTDALTAFGMKASDSGRFADILAVAASNANTNVGMMGDTFKYVAPVAGALGYSAEDTAVSIGLMANSGIKASQAGTQLRSIITRLSTDAGASSTQLGALGVLTEKLGVAFYNADGSARELNAVIADSRAAWAGLSEEQQITYAKTIAGQEAMSGWLALMNAADTDVQKLTASVDNCAGAAKRMAEVRLDNLNGQLTLMDSAMDALKTTIGEQFNPELRRMAEAGTDVLTQANSFVQENPALVKGIMAATGAAGGLVMGITGVTAAMKLASVASGIFAGTMGAALGPVLGVGAAIAGVVGVVTAFTTATDDGIPTVKELSEAARDMREAMDEAGASHQETSDQILATAEVAGMYIDKLEEIEEATDGAVEGNQEYHNILALLTRTVPELADDIDLTTNTINGGTEALRQHTAAWKKDAETQAYQNYINSLYDQYGEVMAESAENSIKLTQAQIKLETAEKNHAATVERMDALLNEARENGEALSDEYYQMESALQGYDQEMNSARKEIDRLSSAIDADAEAVAAAEAEIDSTTAAIEQMIGAVKEQTEADAEATAQTQELQGAISTTMEAVSRLTEAYNEAYDAALKSVSGQYELWDQAAKVVEVSAGAINTALESQVSYWQDYNANLQALGNRTGEIEGLSDVIASFADGSKESVNAIAGMANASDEELKDMVSNWQEVQREQDAVSESIAALKTDFTARMDELQDELAEDIKAMDMGEEAKAAGRATILGYINAANEMLPQVQSAYGALTKAAINAMWNTHHRDIAWDDRPETGYASGTDSAKPGFALVGENGPELMFFNGGEKVLSAAETAALQNRSTMSAQAESAIPDYGGWYSALSVPVTIQIAGNADQGTVEDLHSVSQDIVDMVLDAIDERAEDEKRCLMR